MAIFVVSQYAVSSFFPYISGPEEEEKKFYFCLKHVLMNSCKSLYVSDTQSFASKMFTIQN